MFKKSLILLSSIITGISYAQKSPKYAATVPKAVPLVSIITSIYKADTFIKHFLKDITRQTFFRYCELILINANSPGKEEQKIKQFLNKHNYSNIIYIKLKRDPGLYGTWNYAIKNLAQGEFLINANVDDIMAPNLIETHALELLINPSIALVYADHYVTSVPNETFENNSSNGQYAFYNGPSPEFSKQAMQTCPMGCHPMWRRSLHDTCGLFDESFKIAGDWEMWLRAVKYGAVFKKVPGVYGLYFFNPNGLSTLGFKLNEKGDIEPYTTDTVSSERRKLIREEGRRIKALYKEFFDSTPILKSFRMPVCYEAWTIHQILLNR